MRVKLCVRGYKVIKIRLKELLEKKNISQAKFSRMSDLSMNTIQTIYHNPTTDVMLSTVEKMAKTLQVRLDELLEME
jgi:transcriptional regulator with XRE-family HTH domain